MLKPETRSIKEWIDGLFQNKGGAMRRRQIPRQTRARRVSTWDEYDERHQLTSTPPIGGGNHVTKVDSEVSSRHVTYLNSGVGRVNAALQERNCKHAKL